MQNPSLRILPVLVAIIGVGSSAYVREARAAGALSGMRVAIVPDGRTLPKKVRGAIDRQVTAALGRSVEVIGARRVMSAAKRAGAGFPSTPDAAAALGAQLEATQVLMLSSEARRRGRAQLVAVLVDVDSGELHEVGRFEMKRGRLGPKSGRRLSEQVTRQLEAMATGSDSGGSVSAVADAGDTGGAVEASSSTGEDSPWDDVASDSSTGAPAWASQDEEPVASVTKSDDGTSSSRGGGSQESFRIRVGGVAFQRAGKVEGAQGGQPRRFETDGWLPGAAVRLELFPFGSSRSRASGVGLEADGYAARVVNLVQDEAGYNNATIVYSAHGGVFYRAHLWGSSTAPIIGGGLGYAMYSFPVDSELFPALGYSGPRGTLELSVPLGSMAALGVSGGYTLPMGMHAEAASLGKADIGASRAYSGEASVSVKLSMVEVTVFAGMERYELTFDGDATAASLAGASDTTVSDQTLRGGLTLGLVL